MADLAIDSININKPKLWNLSMDVYWSTRESQHPGTALASVAAMGCTMMAMPMPPLCWASRSPKTLKEAPSAAVTPSFVDVLNLLDSKLQLLSFFPLVFGWTEVHMFKACSNCPLLRHCAGLYLQPEASAKSRCVVAICAMELNP